MATKYLIFDSGALINLAQNSLLTIFRDLEKMFQGDFLIPPAVKYETVDHPINIKRFEWGALRINALIEDEILKSAQDEELATNKEIMERTEIVMQKANNSFFANGKPIHLIERGESECLALSLILSERKMDNCVVIDERTARMLCENPDNLKNILESKLETKIEVDEKNVSYFKNIKILRSTEMIYIAFKRKILDNNRKILEGILYAIKYSGCSISEKEVQIMKNTIR